MATAEQFKEDLHYVRGVLEKGRQGHFSWAVALLWAAFVLAGFAMIDLRPQTAGLFFLFGAPVCYLISLRLGYRAAVHAGIGDRAMGWRHALHWGSIFLGMAALLAVSRAGGVDGPLFGQLIVILVGVIYFLGGVHFQIKPFLWLGPLMMAGAVALGYVDGLPWTALGVLAAVGILTSAVSRPSLPRGEV